MKELAKYKIYIASLLGYFAVPQVAELLKLKIDNVYAAVIAIALAFVVEHIIK